MATPLGPSAEEKAAGFADKDDFEFIELLNTGSETVNLRDMRFKEGIDLTFFDDMDLPAGMRGVLVRNRAAFRARHGTNVRILGEFVGSLDDGGERVALFSALYAATADFSYDNDAPWPEALAGRSLVLRGENLDPANPANWRPSVTVGGNPASTDSTSYHQWKTAHGVTDETKDLDGDGLLPIVEYATGGSPAASDTTRLPQVSIANIPRAPAGDYLLIAVRRQRGTDDLAISFERSDTQLAQWGPATVEPYSSTPMPDGTDLEVWKVLPPIDAAPTAFLRVRWTWAH
jgi:hypothetical protein